MGATQARSAKVLGTPWRVSYHDGSGNGYRFWKGIKETGARFEYSPVQPEKSSTGFYSGGKAKQGELDPKRARELWRWVGKLEADASLRTDSRNKGTGAFDLKDPAGGARSFIIEDSPRLREFNQFLTPFRGGVIEWRIPAGRGAIDVPSGSMEARLRALAERRRPEALTIRYSDMHGLWGGVTVTLSHSGAYERLERRPGAAAPEAVRGTLAPERVREILRLLIETKAWEQLTPERAPVPDESRGTLTLRSGSLETSIWEWYNELQKNARLIRVRDRLVELLGQK